MTDRPIIFSAPMVRALLSGIKTQTRRTLTRSNVEVLGSRWGSRSPWEGLRFAEGTIRQHSPRDLYVPFCHPDDEPIASSECATYRLSSIIEEGDRLWVREAWAPLDAITHGDPGVQALCDNGFYRADDGTVDGEISRWSSPIHMPRRASRMTLTITDVRIQRLQEISEADAIAEGMIQSKQFPDRWMTPSGDFAVPVVAYQRLWESINGAGSWDANPWVVAYSFTVARRNIDATAVG